MDGMTSDEKKFFDSMAHIAVQYFNGCTDDKFYHLDKDDEYELSLKFEIFVIESLKKLWFEENAPLGKELGYPDCCIKEFCDQHPELLNRRVEVPQSDKDRYKAGCVNGNYTGFIPCIKHAKEILSGKIILDSLIKNRNIDFPPFPEYAPQETITDDKIL